MKFRYCTSESVTEGHPDKLCDQVADAILDAVLAQDSQARVACECVATTGTLMIMGEMTTECYVDISAVARKTLREIGYTRAKYGFDADTCGVLTAIDGQSPDIAQGVNHAYDAKDALDIGAGDQGMMYGYACDETPEHMPMALVLAHRICQTLAAKRKTGALPFLRPDGKAQVTLAYTPDGAIDHIAAVVCSAQHDENIPIEDLRRALLNDVILPCLPAELVQTDTQYFINPTGRFVIGGPQGDSGLTGRKIIVDTYGGYARHGGG